MSVLHSQPWKNGGHCDQAPRNVSSLAQPGTDEYGEKCSVLLLGGLHIEMAILNVIGGWLDGSGWSYVMISSSVITEGRAVGLLKVHTYHETVGTSSDGSSTV